MPSVGEGTLSAMLASNRVAKYVQRECGNILTVFNNNVVSVWIEVSLKTKAMENLEVHMNSVICSYDASELDVTFS